MSLSKQAEGKPRASQRGRRFWRSLLANRRALVGLCGISLLLVSAVFSDLICRYDPIAHGNLLTGRYLPPSFDHFFGADKFGRDVFSRVLHGGHISLAIAFSVVFITAIIGLAYGAISGYLGGAADAVMMRLLDFLLAFPAIFLIMAVVAIFDMNHWFLVPILGLTGWMETARIVRAEVLSVKEREFVQAARGLGFGHARILTRHIIPNCLTPVIVAATLKVGDVLLLESVLSFLGIGVQPPTPSWGGIINEGREVLLRAWWISTFPGLFIAIAVLSFVLLSDGVRQSLSPGAGGRQAVP